MKVELTIENIKPDQAEEMLANKLPEQRNIREAYVSSLAEEIRSGKWRLTPDAILIVKGQLANGQHRLSAIMRARKACEVIVMRSDDESLYKVIDSGLKRKVADTLLDVPNACLVAASAKWIMSYDSGSIYSVQNRTGRMTRTALVEWTQKHVQDVLDAVTFVKPLYRKAPVLTASLAVALLVIASRKQPDCARKFITEVYEGTDRLTAARDMHSRCLQNASSRAKLPSVGMFALLIKAFRSFQNGTRPGVLKWTRVGDTAEEFPRLQD